MVGRNCHERAWLSNRFSLGFILSLILLKCFGERSNVSPELTANIRLMVWFEFYRMLYLQFLLLKYAESPEIVSCKLFASIDELEC